MAPKKTAFKASTIEVKIGVHIELNMNPDFFFNCRELSMWSFWVRLNQKEYNQDWVKSLELEDIYKRVCDERYNS